MKVEGTWKAVGQLASYNMELIIKDGIVEFTDLCGEIRKVEYILEDCTQYGDLTEEVKRISFPGKAKDDDIILHSEEHDGQLVSVISFMTMEYDGRGLIVISEYVHEDDYQYVAENFTSNIYHFCNDRKATPMMNLDASALLGMNMMEMMKNIK